MVLVGIPKGPLLPWFRPLKRPLMIGRDLLTGLGPFHGPDLHKGHAITTMNS